MKEKEAVLWSTFRTLICLSEPFLNVNANHMTRINLN